MEEPASIIDRLAATRCGVEKLKARCEPGVYALYLTGSAEVPGVAQPGTSPLYLGISTNLAQREFDAHFAAGKSGFSTVRRSLGALLLVSLALKPRPRGAGSSKGNFTNYRFDEEGERALSDWMTKNLEAAVLPVSDPGAVEDRLIALAQPPLNLTFWENPDRAAIKAARKRCADAARADGALN